jgi:hypothetical protein
MLETLTQFAKYVASFLKSDWSLADYPIRTREFTNPPALSPNSHLTHVRWSAQILVGHCPPPRVTRSIHYFNRRRMHSSLDYRSPVALARRAA